MVLLLILIIVMAVCGGFTKTFPLRITMDIPREPIRRKVFENDLSSDSVNEIYNTYYSVANHKEEQLNFVSQIQQVDLNKIRYSHYYDVNGDPYLLVKAMRHRNKRYSSYLTLCPFKICNMGRKRTRTRRYVHTIRATDDNEES